MHSFSFAKSDALMPAFFPVRDASKQFQRLPHRR
jgi:hypothetical protein